MLVPAEIQVTWNSNYAGPHRVCYRIFGSGDPYTCTTAGTHPNCAGGGAPCAYNISVMVDNETCDSVTWEGYVQAACEDESSMVGRIPFSVTFVPDPEYNHYVVTCDTAGIFIITPTALGSGYAPGDPVVIVGDGLGATAVVNTIDGGGGVLSITVVTPGSGYTTAAADLTGSGDGLATATVQLANCPKFELEGANAGPHQEAILATGRSVSVCAVATPTVGAGMSVVQSGECICQDCYTITVENTSGGPLNASWLDCGDSEVKTQSIAAFTTVQLGLPCSVIVGSVTLEEGLLIDSSVLC